MRWLKVGDWGPICPWYFVGCPGLRDSIQCAFQYCWACRVWDFYYILLLGSDCLIPTEKPVPLWRVRVYSCSSLSTIWWLRVSDCYIPLFTQPTSIRYCIRCYIIPLLWTLFRLRLSHLTGFMVFLNCIFDAFFVSLLAFKLAVALLRRWTYLLRRWTYLFSTMEMLA